MKLRVPLPRAVPRELAADLEKQAAHVSPHVRRLIVIDDGRCAEVDIDLDPDPDPDPGISEREIMAKLQRYLSTMIARYRPLERTVLVERRGREGRYLADAHADLVGRGWVIPLGPGQAALAGPAARFAAALDARLAHIGRTEFGAVDEVYPTLIPSTALARCGYFGSFPHSITFAAHLPPDLDVLEEFRAANEEAGERGLALPAGALATPEACLRPAVCYHAYLAREGLSLPDGTCITSSGRCFRWESRNMIGLDRLWDFTMREIVFIGGEARVAGLRKRAIEILVELVDELGLDVTIETANDPFFSTSYAQKSYWQTRGQLKYELRLPVGPGRVVAAGSFNLHEDFFGRTFAITCGGAPASTGCAAFGLERWVLAAFAHHGLDPSGWPAAWRSHVFA